MATIQTFREQVQEQAVLAVYSYSYFSRNVLLNDVLRVFREARSGYTEEILTPTQQDSRITTVDSLPIFPVDPDMVVDSLRAGEKAFQLRVWQIEEDRESSGNDVLLTAGVEIEVHRRMAFPDEEYLYTSNEMLAEMGKLLDHEAWKALTSLDSFVEDPSIDEAPERDNDILRYTVAFSAVVAPN